MKRTHCCFVRRAARWASTSSSDIIEPIPHHRSSCARSTAFSKRACSALRSDRNALQPSRNAPSRASSSITNCNSGLFGNASGCPPVPALNSYQISLALPSRASFDIGLETWRMPQRADYTSALVETGSSITGVCSLSVIWSPSGMTLRLGRAFTFTPLSTQLMQRFDAAGWRGRNP